MHITYDFNIMCNRVFTRDFSILYAFISEMIYFFVMVKNVIKSRNTIIVAYFLARVKIEYQQKIDFAKFKIFLNSCCMDFYHRI